MEVSSAYKTKNIADSSCTTSVSDHVPRVPEFLSYNNIHSHPTCFLPTSFCSSQFQLSVQPNIK